jgi:hypothetical protein
MDTTVWKPSTMDTNTIASRSGTTAKETNIVMRALRMGIKAKEANIVMRALRMEIKVRPQHLHVGLHVYPHDRLVDLHVYPREGHRRPSLRRRRVVKQGNLLSTRRIRKLTTPRMWKTRVSTRSVNSPRCSGLNERKPRRRQRCAVEVAKHKDTFCSFQVLQKGRHKSSLRLQRCWHLLAKAVSWRPKKVRLRALSHKPLTPNPKP